jgi:hypothetical protein
MIGGNRWFGGGVGKVHGKDGSGKMNESHFINGENEPRPPVGRDHTKDG